MYRSSFFKELFYVYVLLLSRWQQLFVGSFKFCLRAEVECTDTYYIAGQNAISDLKMESLRSNDNSLPACSEADKSNKTLIQVFWGSNTTCREGLNFRYNLGSYYNVPNYPIKNLSCCSAETTKPACNDPYSDPPVIKCLHTQSSIAEGFCAGKTFEFSVCAISQESKDSKAIAFTKVIWLAVV
jgi:hypothetical protein